ncbi:hypothetical protein DVH05_007611 [Phytophthora capsici]|nr:hypothetical protein DVH05_007611 [Phytophthora capsici]
MVFNSDEATSDNERDAMRPASSVGRTPNDSYAGRPFDVPAALDFLLESGPNMTLQQVRVVDQIIDRAITETRELLHSNADKLPEGDGRLGDLLVVAFQCAASYLDRTGKDSSDAHQLPSRCSQVIDAVCAISMKDGEPMGQQMLWQELLCHRWDEVAARLALELLLLRAQLDFDCENDNWMDILHVVSSTYVHFPVELKRFCVDQVAALVTTFIDEGPAYQLTPRMQLQLELLKYLATVDFLDNSDDLDIEQWLGDYFPNCFACCGVVLQLLDDWEQEDDVGMLSMLDMGLLVLNTVLGTFATKRDDTRTLLKILTPTIISALTQLTSRPAISNEPNAEKILSSCLETSLYLLVKVMFVIEEGECDAMMGIFERLLAPSSASDFNTRSALLSGCFGAIHQILVHSSVAQIMGPTLIKLLEGGDLKVLYVHYTSRQARAVGNSSHCACYESDKDSETEKSAPIALFSGMGLDDTEDSDEFTAQDPDEIPTCSGVSVLRPDAPQWFDEEDSDDDANEMENVVSSPLENTVGDHTTSGIACIASTTTISQWFDDTDDEDEVGIELP